MVELTDTLPLYLHKDSESVSQEVIAEAENVEKNMSDFLENDERTASLRSAETIDEFIDAFQTLFPPHETYNHDLNSHLDIKTLKNGLVDCNSAAILLALWLEKRKDNLNPNTFFILKRGNNRNHTFVVTSTEQVQVRNENNQPGSINKKLIGSVVNDISFAYEQFHFFRLTMEGGLAELDEEEKKGKLLPVMFNLNRPIGRSDTAEAAYAFSTVQELILYLVADKGYRNPADRSRPQN